MVEQPIYRIVTAPNVEALAIMVNQEIMKGFVPFGSLVAVRLNNHTYENGNTEHYYEFHQVVFKKGSYTPHKSDKVVVKTREDKTDIPTKNSQ